MLSTWFWVFFSVTLVSLSGHHLPDGRTRKGYPEEERTAPTMFRDRQQRANSLQGNRDCQEGDGRSYSGMMNVTSSGRTCQAWAASEPHEHNFTGIGDHNYCRNSHGDGQGVWCFTTDPNMQWEYCSVPMCDAVVACQTGDPLGVTYIGRVSVTASGRTCQAWSASQPHDHSYKEIGDHNYWRW